MSLLGRMLARRQDSGRKATSLDLLRALYVRPSKSGQNVTVETALRVSGALACVRVIAEGLAQAPLKVMRESAPGNKSEARELPLYDVLYRRPNEWQTSFELRETMAVHLCLKGNFFAFVNRVQGQIVELIPLKPQQVTVKRLPKYGGLSYVVTGDDGAKQDFTQEAIWHVRWLGFENWTGLDPLLLAREAIGLAMAAEESQANLHAQGLRVSGLYSVDGTLNDQQYEQLRSFIKNTAMGGVSDGGLMILDRAAKFTQTAMTGVDAQHIETRRFQIEEMCRFYRVMPIMVGQSDKAATYASAEQMFLNHGVHTLMPWYERIQQSADVQLLSAEQRAAGYFVKFNANALMRGAALTRAQFYGAGIKDGWMTRNEARDNEDLNRLDGLDEPLSPLNMGPGGDVPPPDPPAEGT